MYESGSANIAAIQMALQPLRDETAQYSSNDVWEYQRVWIFLSSTAPMDVINRLS